MRYPVIREWVVITLLLATAIAIATKYDWFNRWDNYARDIALQLWERPVTDDVVIIGIDEKSLDQLGRWPWQRTLQATLLDKVSSARPAAIGLDIILTEPDRTNPAADQCLAV